MIASIQAGKIICEESGWETSTLRLQKLLYIACMFYAGEQHKRLIKEDFEAWRRGPVEPKLYRYCRGYGANSIPDIFPMEFSNKPTNAEYQYLRDVVKATQGKVEGTEEVTLSELLNYTHWDKGAWRKVYNSEFNAWYLPSPIISFESISKEYKDRYEQKMQ